MAQTAGQDRRRQSRRETDRSTLTDAEWRAEIDSLLGKQNAAIRRMGTVLRALDPTLGEKVEQLTVAVNELRTQAVSATDRAYLDFLLQQMPAARRQEEAQLLDELRPVVKDLKSISAMADVLRVMTTRHLEAEEAARREAQATHHNLTLGKELLMVLIGLLVATVSIILANVLTAQQRIGQADLSLFILAGLGLGCLAYVGIAAYDRRVLARIGAAPEKGHSP